LPRLSIEFPKWLLDAFESSKTILIYGPEGSGKTNLVLTYILTRLMESSSCRAVYVSTEGSSYMDRVRQLSLLDYGDRILFAEALDAIHLLSLVVRSLVIHTRTPLSIVAIDSINYHYRAESSIHALKVFLTTLILLKALTHHGVQVLAVAQVREGEDDLEPSGFKYLHSWCDRVLRLYTIRGPHKRVCDESRGRCQDFVIHYRGIQWLQSGKARDTS